MTDSRLLTPTQAAKYLGVSRSTFYTLRIRRVKVGTASRYDVQDLDAFIEAHKEERAA